MGDPLKSRFERRVHLETLHGPVEGSIRINPMLRTLDDLNVVAKTLLSLRQPDVSGVGWAVQGGELGIAKSCILMVHELSNPPQRPGRPVGGQFSRAPLRLRVAQFEVAGFVHVPAGGTAMHRLNQGNHPFLSVTSASVTGPKTQFAAPFLAINREHTWAAHELTNLEATPDPEGSGEPEIQFEITSKS